MCHPNVIDLQGDGIVLADLSSSTVFFDVNDVGFRNNAGWVAVTDALLAYVKNDDSHVSRF